MGFFFMKRQSNLCTLKYTHFQFLTAVDRAVFETNDIFDGRLLEKKMYLPTIRGYRAKTTYFYLKKKKM